MRKICFVILLLMAQFGCQKQDNQSIESKTEPPISFANILSCHNSSSWDSLKISNKILGKWKWQYIKCFWNPEDANNKDYLGLQIEFKPNRTLEITQVGQASIVANWQLENLRDGYYKINTSPLVPQAVGKILICDSTILFYDSYIDGCDNYFKSN